MVQPNKDMVVPESEYTAYQYAYKKDFRTALPQIIAVSVKNLLLISYGMTLGFPTIVIPAVKDPIEGEKLHLQNSEISWLSSINLIVVPIGCALSGLLTSPLGRRRAMQVVNVPFFIAWIIFHYSSSTSHLYAGLCLTGFAGGLLESPVLTYVAEISQPHLRGMLSATSSMCIIIGVFTQFLFGLMFYWRTVALVNIIFTVLAVVALFFVPESPHWLVSRKRHDDARKSLQWLRGWIGPNAVEHELKDIQLLFKKKKVEDDTDDTICEKMSMYMERSFLVPYFLVSYAFFVGHFSGMTTLQMLEAPIDKYYATLILGILQILGCCTCVVLVHYTGKRPLIFFSTTSAGICCLLVAGYDGYIRTHDVLQPTEVPLVVNASTTLNATVQTVLKNPYSWIPTSLLMLLAMVTHSGIRLLPWILIGEVFSAKTRAGGAGLASAIGYIFGFLTNKMYISMVDTLSIWGTYGFYGFICISGSAVFYFILPETEGKKLHDIENHFAGINKLTNQVHRSQRKTDKEVAKMRKLKGTANPTFEGNCTTL